MNKLLVSCMLLSSFVLLAGCTHNPKTSDEIFDANHDGEMEKKEKGGEQDGVSATIELLRKDDAKNVLESDILLDDKYRAYYFAPATDEVAPGIVIVHERWGLNDNVKDMGRVLASEGYQVIAVDLYGGKVARNIEEAIDLVGKVDQGVSDMIMLSAESYLRSKNATKVASLGRCFGGAQSLSMSLASDTLDATVIYYGRLQTDPAVLSNIKGPLLGIFGADDGSIPVDVVNEFGGVLDSIGVQNSIHIYTGAGHAFANPTGSNFEQEQTVDAWDKTLEFLDENLK